MSVSRMVRVLIVDDHELIRDGVMSLLNPEDNLTCIGQTQNIQEAISLCKQWRPHVVLLGENLCETDIIDTVWSLRRAYRNAEVLLLYREPQNPRLLRNMFDVGVISCIPYCTSSPKLIDSIQRAAAGIPALSNRAVRALINQAVDLSAEQSKLTPRENQVLNGMIDGLNNRQIGEKLGVSHHTVKEYVSNTFGKIGVKNRVEAVRFALEKNRAAVALRH